MRSNQWYILGFTFLLLGMFFIWQDTFWGNTCDAFDVEDLGKPLSKPDLSACIQAEMFEPFIWCFHVFWIVCWVNAWIESKAEKRGKK